MDMEGELEEAENSFSEASEEEEGEEEVSPDEERDEKLDGADSETEHAAGRKKRKRKRSKHQPGHRRALRSKYESVEDFNPDARSAQTEELERIRRLELQQSLLGGSTSAVSEEESTEGALNRENSGSQEAVVVDLTEVIEEDETKAEAIVIESGSESEGEEEGTGKRAKVDSTASAVKRSVRRLNRKYDVIDPCPDGRVLINVGHAPEEEDVFLPPQLAAVVKPHQVGGIRFLYDNIIESQSRFPTTPGFGCILAHSMGLGKTLQIISFIDIFLHHTPAKHVLCVVPVNTLQNWIAEFNHWLPACPNGGGKSDSGISSNSCPQGRQNPGKANSPADKLSDMACGSECEMETQVSASSSSGDVMSAGVSDTGAPTLERTQQIASSLALRDILTPGAMNLGGHSSMQTQGSSSFGAGDTGTAHNSNTAHQDAESAVMCNSEPQSHYRAFRLFVLSEVSRTMDARLQVILQWRKEGGVLLIGYEMFRLLSLSVPSLGGNKMAVKRRKPARKEEGSNTIDLEENEKEMDSLIAIQQGLCRPGPDLVVCDEGHRIKNDYTNSSQSLKRIRTRRRIVMTGYPLQNNLMEYWCMVDFVRPAYLGTKQEFADLFERPISNGQCVDSTSADVRLMRYRSHVLHAMLQGFVLRRGHEILQAVLPPKFEHVLFLRPSSVQAALYNYSIQNIQQGGGGMGVSAGPLKTFAVCSKIWNHPDIYYNEAVAKDSKRSSPTSWLDEAGLPKTLLSKSDMGKIEWPSSLLPTYQPGLLQNSPKMVVLIELVDRAVQQGDRVLVFSQSLSTLSYIEKLLSQRPIPIPHSSGLDGSIQYSNTKWSKHKNYFRLDGSTNSLERDRLINKFNSQENKDCWVFLLSTRAGCLGVNLVGANRVIVVDVSWNPCYDAQAVCRVYRYGQTKPCYIYRLVCDGTMEKKIYDRQINKQGMADRVIDELHPERHFTTSDILTLMAPLLRLPPMQDFSPFASNYLFDPLLMNICKRLGHLLTKLPFKHESLLIDSEDERMTEVEKYMAMRGFQQDWYALRRASAYNSRTQQLAASQAQLQQQRQQIVQPVQAAATTSKVTGLQPATVPSARVGVPVLSTPANASTQQQHQHQQQGANITSGGGGGGGGDRRVQSDSATVEVICLDSDEEEEDASRKSSPSSSNSASNSSNFSLQSTNSFSATPIPRSLLPGPRVMTAASPSTNATDPVLAATLANIIAAANQGKVNLLSAAGPQRSTGVASSSVLSRMLSPASLGNQSSPVAARSTAVGVNSQRVTSATTSTSSLNALLRYSQELARQLYSCTPGGPTQVGQAASNIQNATPSVVPTSQQLHMSLSSPGLLHRVSGRNLAPLPSLNPVTAAKTSSMGSTRTSPQGSTNHVTTATTNLSAGAQLQAILASSSPPTNLTSLPPQLTRISRAPPAKKTAIVPPYFAVTTATPAIPPLVSLPARKGNISETSCSSSQASTPSGQETAFDLTDL